MGATRDQRKQRAAAPRPQPAEQGPGGRPIRRSEGHGAGLIVGAALVVLVGTLLLWNLARNASEGKVNLGNATFELGDPDDRAETIARTGPLLFQALLGDADIWVNRVGETWVAFRAAAPGQPRTCSLVYRPGTGDFADPCTGTAYPPDGGGLDHFLIEVRRERLVVDLRARLTGPGGTRVIDPTATSIIIPPTTAAAG